MLLNSTTFPSAMPVFTSAAPPGGTFNAPYTYTVTATGVPSPTFAVTGGALPTGLTLNAISGVVSGTPSAGGTFVGTLTASNGVPPPATQAFSIVIARGGQTITFGALSNRVIGTGPVTVSASASSGLPVIFASLTSAVCTVSGSTVTLVIAGTCTIQASQAGNATYAAAANVSQSFTVAKAAQTIIFGALTNKILGAAPFAIGATASSGLAVSFASLTTSVCTMSGSTVTLIAVGTCTIRASQAGNATYAAALNVDQSFIVNAGLTSQTITFGVLSGQIFGAAPFTVSATASSGLAVTFASLTSAVCTVSGSTVTLVGAGTCTIQASQAGNATYAAAPSVSQSLTVAKAAQTISFGALANKILGAAPFTVGATASSGLAVSFASLTTPVCTVSGSTVTLVSAGTCTIQASQVGNGNYLAAANVSQGFTVTALTAQTITFTALGNRILGAAPFAVAATASSGLPVSFASLTTPVCTVGGSTVTLVSAGTCTIQASQAGNADLRGGGQRQPKLHRNEGDADHHLRCPGQ